MHILEDQVDSVGLKERKEYMELGGKSGGGDRRTTNWRGDNGGGAWSNIVYMHEILSQ